MSLDIYFHSVKTPKCPHCGAGGAVEELHSQNITHNLNRMASEAGIYKHLWRPEEIGVTKAGQITEPLRAAIALMESEPARFIPLSASNGWGTYEQFIPWLKELLAACESYPDADVSVCR